MKSFNKHILWIVFFGIIHFVISCQTEYEQKKAEINGVWFGGGVQLDENYYLPNLNVYHFKKDDTLLIGLFESLLDSFHYKYLDSVLIVNNMRLRTSPIDENETFRMGNNGWAYIKKTKPSKDIESKSQIYKQLGAHNEAIREFTQAIKDEGNLVDIYAYVYRGISYSETGDLEKALVDFNYVIDVEDGCTAAYFWKAETLRNVDKTESLKCYKLAQELLQKNTYRSDSYMELFDIPVLPQVEDRMASLQATL